MNHYLFLSNHYSFFVNHYSFSSNHYSFLMNHYSFWSIHYSFSVNQYSVFCWKERVFCGYFGVFEWFGAIFGCLYLFCLGLRQKWTRKENPQGIERKSFFCCFWKTDASTCASRWDMRYGTSGGQNAEKKDWSDSPTRGFARDAA